MTQTPFKGGSFNPFRAANYVPALQSNYDLINRGFDRSDSQRLQNEQANVRNAENTAQILSQFSQKFGKLLEEQAKERKANQMAEGMELYYTEGFNKEEADRFDEVEKTLREEDIQLSAIGSKQTDIFLDERFRNLSANKQLGFTIAWAQNRAAQYNPAMVEDITRTLDPVEYNRQLANYRKNFYKQFAGINPAIMNKYVFPEQRNSEKAAYGSWYASRKKAIEDERKETSSRELIQGLKTGDGLSLIRYAEKMQHDFGGSIGKSKDSGFEITKKAVDNGVLNADDIAALGDTWFTPKGSNKQVQIKKHFPGKMDELRVALYEREKREYTMAEGQKTIEFGKDEQALIDKYEKMLDNGEQITEDMVRQDKRSLEEDYPGKNSSKLAYIESDLTLEAKTLEKYTKAAEDLADMGLLTKDRLAEFPWQVQRKLQDVAQLQTSANTQQKVYLEAIKDAVNITAKPLPDGSRHPSARILVAQMQAQYMKRVQDLVSVDTPNPHEQAFNEINAQFQARLSVPGFKTAKGFNIFDKPAAVYQNQTAANIKIQTHTNYLTSMGTDALNSPGAFFDGAELSTAFKGYGKAGWNPPPLAEWLGDKLGVDPLTALNLQVDAWNKNNPDDKKERFELTPAYEALEKNVTPEGKILINQDKTLDSVSRGWGTTGVENVELVHDYETLNAVAEETGITFAQAATINDLGALDEDNATEWWKSVWKYSGGTDINALNNLKRPAFQ
tara:strand:+ start:703 stop:2895 length:2193 start_codon:yes stop_codon:yes gene_type:complete